MVSPYFCILHSEICNLKSAISNLQSQTRSSPAHAQRNRTEVGADAVVLAMHVAELDVDVDIGSNLAADAAAEVVTNLVLVFVQESSAYRQAAGVTVAPPGEERAAGGPGNGTGGIEFA